MPFRIFLLLFLTLFSNTSWSNEPAKKPNPTLNCGTPSALSTCIKANKSAAYYIEQSELYFRTMESTVPPWVQPEYSDEVIRWEWPPWLWLTGYGRWNLIWTDTLLKLFPTAYDKIDCRFFEKQPFGRCHVVFNYSGRLCPIYEEFTFNQQGEITFIEAWTDHEGWLPMPIEDVWAEGGSFGAEGSFGADGSGGEGVHRLANKVPGLGNETGLINKDAAWMKKAAEKDADIRNLLERLHKPYRAYFKTLKEHGEDVLAGCDPPVESGIQQN
jgi:hypothetical protein